MDKFEKLKDLVKDIKIAMLTTVDTDGSLRSRPMSVSEIDNGGCLWFFTPANAPKAEEIEHDGHVNVSFMEKGTENYVSISGQASTIKDRNKIDELWSPILKAWFPEGKKDPNIALIRVEIEKAEYWDSPSGKLKQVFGMARAVVTGHRYDDGDNEKLNFK
ncbi:MAG: pyridoxamine 5'-phosphate oxidase family protein [Cytophagaceae bacterium]